MWRVILAILGASAVGLVFCAISGEFEAEWLGLAWVVVVTITGMFLFARWLGFRMVGAMASGPVQIDKTQFSLIQLFLLTTVVAAIAAVARQLTPLVATMNALIFGVAIAICLGTVALVATWTTLESVTTRMKQSILAIVTVGMAGLVCYAMEATNADPGLVWGSVVIVYTITLVGLLLLGRSRGFRLLRGSG
jgi:hypothetical protein